MSATVEEYHPEVVAFVERLAERIGERSPFANSLESRIASLNFYPIKSSEARLIQFLLSECAKPLPKSEGVQ